jgi:hypothetical protein
MIGDLICIAVTDEAHWKYYISIKSIVESYFGETSERERGFKDHVEVTAKAFVVGSFPVVATPHKW